MEPVGEQLSRDTKVRGVPSELYRATTNFAILEMKKIRLYTL